MFQLIDFVTLEKNSIGTCRYGLKVAEAEKIVNAFNIPHEKEKNRCVNFFFERIPTFFIPGQQKQKKRTKNALFARARLDCQIPQHINSLIRRSKQTDTNKNTDTNTDTDTEAFSHFSPKKERRGDREEKKFPS